MPYAPGTGRNEGSGRPRRLSPVPGTAHGAEAAGSPRGAGERPVRRTNDFGLAEAALGLVAGVVLVSLIASIVGAFHLPHGPGRTLVTDVAGLVGWWGAFLGSAVVASRRHEWSARAPGRTAARPLLAALREDYGLSLRLWPDVPLGLAVGVGSQFLLVPALELPLVPFVPHLFQRLNAPAQSLTGGLHGGMLVVLGLLVCVGAPVFEELMFRGLLLRALGGRLAPLGPRLGPVLATVVTGLVFGLVHFEALQFTALAGFGMVLCVLAWRTGRLGPGIVAHAAFNTTTLLYIGLHR